MSFWILLELRTTEVVVTTGAINLQNSSQIVNIIIIIIIKPTPTFYGLDTLPVTKPNVNAVKGQGIIFHRLAYPKLTWGSFTIKGSWLPC